MLTIDDPRTLTDILASFGIVHVPCRDRETTGRHSLWRGNEYLGDYRADEAWKFLQQIAK